MASGDSRIFKGAFIATGSAMSIDAPGFKPRYVQLINATDASLMVHMEGFAAASMFLQKAGASSIVADSQCVTLTDNGFSIGTNADLNTDSELVHYVCHQ
jgi:hypothetical protein